MPANRCHADLIETAAFLLHNDAGAEDAYPGSPIDAALYQAQANSSALTHSAVDAAACDTILTAYLRAWRPGDWTQRRVLPKCRACNAGSRAGVFDGPSAGWSLTASVTIAP